MFKFIKEKLFRSPKVEEFELVLTPDGEEVTYGNVIGFFKFRDTVYYRAKGTAGRTLDETSLSFTDSIRELYPEEFENASIRDISNMLVQPLRLVD